MGSAWFSSGFEAVFFNILLWLMLTIKLVHHFIEILKVCLMKMLELLRSSHISMFKCFSVINLFSLQCLLFFQDQDKEYVGFATLPNQVHRKSVKKGFDFTLMVAGKS